MVHICAFRSPASAISTAGGDVSSALESPSACVAHSDGEVWDGGVACSAWCKPTSAALTCLYRRAPNQCTLLVEREHPC